MGRGERHVLYVDEDREAARTVRAAIERDDRTRLTHELTAAAAFDRLDVDRVDCVVSAARLPGADGIAFLREVRRSYGDLPFVLYPSDGDESLAARAIGHDVTDYVPRDRTDAAALLATRVRGVTADRRVQCDDREYRTFLDGLPAAVYVLDAADRIVDANRALAALTGRDRADLIGRDRSVLTATGTDGSVAAGRSDAAESGGRPATVTVHRADGSAVVCEECVGPRPDGCGVVGLLREADARRSQGNEAAADTTESSAIGESGERHAADGDGRTVRLAAVIEGAWADVDADGPLALGFDRPYRVACDTSRLRLAASGLLRNASRAGSEIPVRSGPLPDGQAGFYVAGPGDRPEGADGPERGGAGPALDRELDEFGLLLAEEALAAQGWRLKIDGGPGGVRFEVRGAAPVDQPAD